MEEKIDIEDISTFKTKREYKKTPTITAEGKLRVREILKERGMTITDLAEKIGGNREVISRALNGNPTYSLLANIATALELDIQDLFVSENRQCLQGLIICNSKSYVINNIDDFNQVVEIINKKYKKLSN